MLVAFSLGDQHGHAHEHTVYKDIKFPVVHTKQVMHVPGPTVYKVPAPCLSMLDDVQQMDSDLRTLTRTDGEHLDNLNEGIVALGERDEKRVNAIISKEDKMQQQVEPSATDLLDLQDELQTDRRLCVKATS